MSPLLDPYKSSTIPDRTQDPPTPIVDDELERELEEILDSRLRCHQLFHKVRWKNCPPSNDSWEPASDFANSQDLVDEFQGSRYPNKPSYYSRSTT